MKILTLHVDYINFRPLKKAVKQISDLSEQEKKGQKISEALVVLTAVEKGDMIKESVEKLVENVKEIAKKVGLGKKDNLVLYPFAHLSNNLAAPEDAIKILKEAGKTLEKTFNVTKAPFGYYKELEFKVKGHPLSELSREIGAEKGQEKITRKIEKTENYDYKNLLRNLGKNILDRSKLKDYDHRILGQEMDLFSFNEVAPGSVFWHNNGLIIYNELIGFMRKLWKDFEYQEISTPQIFANKLWKVSGHWEHYKDNMFLTEYENKDAGVKPMNCPPAMLLYMSRPRSYKELPLRLAELGIVHRKELSGVLAGLFRVVRLSMDDAHIFCTQEQVESEIRNLFRMFKIVYTDTFKFPYSVELSTRPEKFLGRKEEWDLAEKALENALKKSKIAYKVKKGEGAFYGPKIDVYIKDSLGRSWQVTTIQLDMQMPQRFSLVYTDKDGKEKTPLVIHRAIFGTLERFIGILLEHTKGHLPLWLAPIQVRILSFTDRNENYARKVIKQLAGETPDLRIDADFRSIPVSVKVKDAELMRVPWLITVGDKEQEKNTLAVRHEGKVEYDVKPNDFIKDIKKLIEEKK